MLPLLLFLGAAVSFFILEAKKVFQKGVSHILNRIIFRAIPKHGKEEKEIAERGRESSKRLLNPWPRTLFACVCFYVSPSFPRIRDYFSSQLPRRI